MFLYTGQLEYVSYHHCEVDIIQVAAHPQHNHHSLHKSSNSAVYQPQVADAGHCQACCAAAHHGGSTVEQPAAIFSMVCRVVAHRNQKIAWTG